VVITKLGNASRSHVGLAAWPALRDKRRILRGVSSFSISISAFNSRKGRAWRGA
jgi:hypothetical protein